jgi:hypothetical protein
MSARRLDPRTRVRRARRRRRPRGGLALAWHAAGSCTTEGPVFVPADAQPIAFVQVSAATPQQPQSTVTAAYTVPQQAGDLNVVAVGWNDLVSAVVSVTDSSNNTYALALGPTRGATVSQSIYYAANIQSAAANVVTVAFDRPAAAVDLRVVEYSGLRGVIDRTGSSSGTLEHASAGSMDAPGAPALIVVAGITSWAFSNASTDFAVRILTQPDSDIVADQVITRPGSYAVTAELVQPADWVLQAVLIR